MEIEHYPRTPRLVNRFSLGADPEFIFTSTRGTYVHAEELGFNTMQAFGCDMSGRQAELRAYPSKFALEVVASMLDELRWMAFAKSDVLAYNWNAVAFNGKDGCGGHVHFGRQRGKREQDVKVLDQLTTQLMKSHVIDRSNFEARYAGTGKKYGGLGDYRVQAHGFEYRTFPTQMSSPWLTYFTLVISKLIVHEGTGVTDLKKLLEAYQDKDDDAAIALKALKRLGFPVEYGCDFKLLWGIKTKPEKVPDRLYIPSVIRAEDRTCQEVFDYLVHGIPIPQRVPRPTWEPYLLPERFESIYVQPHTLNHAPNTGMDIVSRDYKIQIAVGTPELHIPETANVDQKAIRGILEKLGDCRYSVYHQKDNMFTIYISRHMNESLRLCNQLNELLSTPTLFPTCKADRINNVDWSRWDVKLSPADKKYKGSLIGVYEAPKPPKKEKAPDRRAVAKQLFFNPKVVENLKLQLQQPMEPMIIENEFIDEEGF